jgi:phage shock protein A
MGDNAQPSLADEIAALESNDKVDRELEAMKRELDERKTTNEQL